MIPTFRPGPEVALALPSFSGGFMTLASKRTAMVFVAGLAIGCSDEITRPNASDGTFGPAFSQVATPLSLPSAWSASGPGTVTLISDGTTADPSMRYLLTGNAVFTSQTWQLSTAATHAQRLTLPFRYTGFHAFFQVRVFVQAFVTTPSGTTVIPLISQGPVNCCTPPSGGFNLSGSVTLTVAPGDVFGFRFGGQNFDSDSRLLGTFSVLPQPVDVDIKPGSDPNSISTKSRGVIPVAILGSADFDVNNVDATTLTFGPDGATPAHRVLGKIEDVNHDGLDDLVSHYPQEATGLSGGDTEACVAGLTGGIRFRGCDAVRIVN